MAADVVFRETENLTENVLEDIVRTLSSFLSLMISFAFSEICWITIPCIQTVNYCAKCLEEALPKPVNLSEYCSVEIQKLVLIFSLGPL